MEQYRKFLKSFEYAFNGLFYCVRYERNFRIHLTFMTYMFSILLLSDWFVLSRTDYALLVMACSGVIVTETVNTAVENAVNHAKETKTSYGKISKDTAAGSVLLSAIFAIVIGLILMFQPEAFNQMLLYFKENPLMLLLFFLSLIPATFFIFWGNPFKRK